MVSGKGWQGTGSAFLRCRKMLSKHDFSRLKCNSSMFRKIVQVSTGGRNGEIKYICGVLSSRLLVQIVIACIILGVNKPCKQTKHGFSNQFYRQNFHKSGWCFEESVLFPAKINSLIKFSAPQCEVLGFLRKNPLHYGGKWGAQAAPFLSDAREPEVRLFFLLISPETAFVAREFFSTANSENFVNNQDQRLFNIWGHCI